MKWFGGEREDVDELVARGKLDRAIRVLEGRLRRNRKDVRVRQQLGDLLGRAGHQRRAVDVLLPLIDDLAREGFVAKAIAIIKKVERIDPGRVDSARLIAQIREQAEPSGSLPLVPAHLEPDTVSFEAPGSEAGPALSTSELDPNWFDELGSKRDSFGWSPLLENLPVEAFDRVVGQLTLLVKNPGAIICAAGEAADSVFVLASGFARVYHRSKQGRYRQLMVFEEGQYFGEEAILEDNAVRPITVTAATQCELLEIDVVSLDRIVTADPNVLQLLREARARREWVPRPAAIDGS